MTAPSPAPRPDTAVLATALAGIVVLAFVGAPQSVNVVLLLGFDQPQVIGSQLLIGFAGAAGIGLAVLLVRNWSLLVVFASMLVTLAYVVHPVAQQGIKVRVVGPGESTGPSDVVQNAGWVALVVGGAAVVLIGVLGAAGQLVRTGRRGTGLAIAGLAAAAGYLGVLLVGWLPASWARITVLVAATVVAAVAVGVGRVTAGPSLPSRAVVLAWVAALLPVVPTVTVAVTDRATYASMTGSVVCWLVLFGAVATAAAAGRGMLPGVLGGGLVLAAPVPLLVVLLIGSTHSTPWWATVVPAAVVMALAAARRPTPAVLTGVLTAAVVIGFLAVVGLSDSLDWVAYVLAAAAVTAAMGVGVAGAVRDVVWLPVFAPLVTAVGVGLRVVLDTVQLDPSGDVLTNLFGTGSFWLTVVMLAGGAVLLVVRRSAEQARTPGGSPAAS